MSLPKPSISRTSSLAGAAVFGALAAVITALWPPSYQFRFPVPGFQFLAFDAAELIDVLAFLLFGPVVGFATAAVHGLVLSVFPSEAPLVGPLLKFLAVSSMLLGLWLGYLLYSRPLKSKGGYRAGLSLMTGFGLVSRVLILTPINYAFLFLFFSTPSNPPSQSYVALYLGWIGVFNAIHALISTLIPYLVMGALLRASPELKGRAWVSTFLRFPAALRKTQ